MGRVGGGTGRTDYWIRMESLLWIGLDWAGCKGVTTGILDEGASFRLDWGRELCDYDGLGEAEEGSAKMEWAGKSKLVWVGLGWTGWDMEASDYTELG